jgi:hypothetical protein
MRPLPSPIPHRGSAARGRGPPPSHRRPPRSQHRTAHPTHKTALVSCVRPPRSPDMGQSVDAERRRPITWPLWHANPSYTAKTVLTRTEVAAGPHGTGDARGMRLADGYGCRRFVRHGARVVFDPCFRVHEYRCEIRRDTAARRRVPRSCHLPWSQLTRHRHPHRLGTQSSWPLARDGLTPVRACLPRQ